METFYKFAVLRAIPDTRKGEIVNVGIAFFHRATVDVRLAPTLGKLLALDGAVDIEEIRKLPEAIGHWTTRFDTVEQKYDAIKHFGLISVSDLGTMQSLPGESYDDAVSRLMKMFVLPRPRDTSLLAPASRITTSLKTMFSRQQIMGRGLEDIHNHMVVPNFPIDADERLFADFALKNGAYWITETADFRAKSNGAIDNMKIAGLASIKLNKAKRRFRGIKVNTFVIYATQDDIPIQGQLNLMSEYADEIVNMQNKKEMARYMNKMLKLAGANRQVS